MLTILLLFIKPKICDWIEYIMYLILHEENYQHKFFQINNTVNFKIPYHDNF